MGNLEKEILRTLEENKYPMSRIEIASRIGVGVFFRDFRDAMGTLLADGRISRGERATDVDLGTFVHVFWNTKEGS